MDQVLSTQIEFNSAGVQAYRRASYASVLAASPMPRHRSIATATAGTSFNAATSNAVAAPWCADLQAADLTAGSKCAATADKRPSGRGGPPLG